MQAEMIALSHVVKHGAINTISNVSFANGYHGISVDYADGTTIRIAGEQAGARVTTLSIIDPQLPLSHPNRIITPLTQERKTNDYEI